MKQLKSQLSRRTLFTGAGAVGAAVAAGKFLPAVQPVEAPPAVRSPPERGGGYQLTEHVRRYYETART